MSQLSKQEIAEAEALLKRAHHRSDLIQNLVLEARTKARTLRPEVEGWGERLIDPLWRTFAAEFSRARAQGGIPAAVCALKWMAKFDELAAVPLAERQGRAAIARNAAITSITAVPIVPAFSAAAFIALMASRGTTFALDSNGNITFRGFINQTDRAIVRAHRAEIVAYLEAPAQVVA